MKKKRWTKEEKIFIKEHISSMTIRELADYFNVSYSAMNSRIYNLGINASKERGVLWSEDEDKILKEHFEYAPKNYLMCLLPNRTWPSITLHANLAYNLHRKTKDRTYVDYNFFSSWNEYSAYFIGFILADGHISDKNNYFEISISEQDVDILQKLQSLMHFEGTIHQVKPHIIHGLNNKEYISSPKVHIRITNTKLVEDLIFKGVPRGNKTYIADFPKDIPDNMVKHCIRGLIDGDGWLSINQKRKSFDLGLSGTQQMCKHVKEKLPIDCSNIPVVRVKNEQCWRFLLTTRKAIEIAEWLYEDANIYLDRKYKVYKQAKQIYDKRRLIRPAYGNVGRTRRENQ